MVASCMCACMCVFVHFAVFKKILTACLGVYSISVDMYRSASFFVMTAWY